LATVKCFKCQKRGHFANHCPEIRKEEGAGGGAAGGAVTTDAPHQLMLAEPPEGYDD
jgi:hypothetical protein